MVRLVNPMDKRFTVLFGVVAVFNVVALFNVAALFNVVARFKVAALMMFSLTTFAAELPDSNRARLNYMLNCQGCHLADGSGLQDVVPNMRGEVGKFLSVPGGRAFLVQVPGSANSPLDNKQLAELLNWILITMSPEQLPEDFALYSEREVAGLRYHDLLNVDQTRASLVAQFKSQGLTPGILGVIGDE